MEENKKETVRRTGAPCFRHSAYYRLLYTKDL